MTRRIIAPGVHIEEGKNYNIPTNLVQEQKHITHPEEENIINSEEDIKESRNEISKIESKKQTSKTTSDKTQVKSPEKEQKNEIQQSLVVVGNATRGGWNTKRGQKFKQIDEKKYEITIYLKANKEYLVLPNYADWDNKWATSNQKDIWQGTLEKQGSGNNFRVPDKTGKYKIELDFSKTKATYKLIKTFV